LPEKTISLVGLKQLARKHLPESSTVRLAIESDPDEVPATIGYEKLKLYGRLFYAEMHLT